MFFNINDQLATAAIQKTWACGVSSIMDGPPALNGRFLKGNLQDKKTNVY